MNQKFDVVVFVPGFDGLNGGVVVFVCICRASLPCCFMMILLSTVTVTVLV